MRMKINQEGEIVFWGALYSMMNKFLAEDLEVMAGVDSFCYQNCLRIVMKITSDRISRTLFKCDIVSKI